MHIKEKPPSGSILLEWKLRPISCALFCDGAGFFATGLQIRVIAKF
jgi:hypothetical protein